MNVGFATAFASPLDGVEKVVRRYTIVGLFALGAMLTAWQLSTAQSARDADFDGNGIVDIGDFILFAQAFGSDQSSFDLDGNGAVDFPDFILFAKQFGEGAPEENITIMLPGDVKLAMVWIQPGKFLMGSPDSESGREDHEGPQHQVSITRGFYLGKYEVTQAQWESVMNTRPWIVGSTSEIPGREKYPANRMRWPEVETFIRKLNEEAGEDVFRLPTEAEWEYACRAGTTSRWSFGEDSTRIADFARYNENSRRTIVRDDGSIAYGSPEVQETGSVFPNPWGLYDMHGNVRELVQDYYGPYSEPAKIDPMGPDGPTGSRSPSGSHVERGGSSFDPPEWIRSASRSVGWVPNAFTGFRLLMEYR
ncbi:MAG: SUMF1/EgtB/PvdO family nonheme iron enzyme [Gemmatimonadota bacterium]|nr:SUMF1/EgtB/PvdO family nonheme iron enzyme [Gemmatimonadota bacterium]